MTPAEAVSWLEAQLAATEKATKGPWHVGHTEANLMVVLEEEDLIIAAVGSYQEDEDAGNSVPDAHLIALSPAVPLMMRHLLETLTTHARSLRGPSMIGATVACVECGYKVEWPCAEVSRVLALVSEMAGKEQGQ